MPGQAPCSAQAMSLSKRDWFRTVRREFLLRGIWGKTSRYLLEELEDHYHSTISTFKTEGIDEDAAEERALEALGDPKRIAQITSQELHPYWRLVKSCILITSVPLIFLASGVFLLKWSGERDWKQAEVELRAKGEKLTFTELVPPMPPQSENFYADPLWAEVADLAQNKHESASDVPVWKPRLPRDQWQLHRWETVPLTPEEKDSLSKLIANQKGIKNREEACSLLGRKLNQEKDPQKQKEMATLYLGIIAPAQPVLERIANLSERPQAQFPIRFDLGPDVPLPHVTTILRFSQILSRQALSELILGKNREAAAHTQTLLRLTSILNNDPVLISFLVRVSSVLMALQPINEGILQHAWSEADLKDFQEPMEHLLLQKDLLFAFRGERAGFNTLFSSKITHGWWAYISLGDELTHSATAKAYRFLYPSLASKSKTYQNLLLQQYLESLAAKKESGWNSSSIHPIDEEVIALSQNRLKKFIYFLNVVATPALEGGTQRTAEAQTQVDQTLIACALERYRIAYESYPTSLEALVPEYLTEVPNSPITGKPMNYSLNHDGTFLLWSPGWELKSQGGKPGEYRGEGDIVWGMPVPMQDHPKANTEGK